MAVIKQGSRGPEVVRIQQRLRELGLYPIPVDDLFGPGAEHGVRIFQAQKGLPPDGIVGPATWQQLFGQPMPGPKPAAPAAPPVSLASKDLPFRVLSLTAGFETGAGVPECFCGVAGNFDGQGVSFGVLQWNLGQGTLQPILKAMVEGHPAAAQAALGDGFAELKSVLARDKAGQMAWAHSIQDASGKRLNETWKSRFRALGKTPECQALQVDGAHARFQTALGLAQQYGLWSERGVALMFDVVVQNGSIRPATRDQIQADFARIPAGASREEHEVQRMRIVANRRAEAANPRFVEDVRRRKLTIAEGTGTVHGRRYDVEAEYGLRLAPFAAG